MMRHITLHRYHLGIVGICPVIPENKRIRYQNIIQCEQKHHVLRKHSVALGLNLHHWHFFEKTNTIEYEKECSCT